MQLSETQPWHLRAFQSQDSLAIRRLYKEVYSQEMSAEEWEWRYLKNPVQKVLINLAESGDGRLAGQYAVMPVKMQIGNETKTGTLSLDTMTHPDFRGQGMFVRLAEDNYARLAAAGVVLTYGFPNQNSHHGFIKHLGWSDLQRCAPVYVKPLKSLGLLQQKLKSKVLATVFNPVFQLVWGCACFPQVRAADSAIRISRVTEFDEHWDELWQRNAETMPVAVVRDQEFLRWRFLQNPVFSYTIFAAHEGEGLAGYVVLRSEERFGLRVGYLVDVLAPSAKVLAPLLSHAEEFLRSQDCSLVSLLMMPKWARILNLRRMGYLRLPESVMPQDLHVGVRVHQGTSELNISDPKNWYLTWADHDRV